MKASSIIALFMSLTIVLIIFCNKPGRSTTTTTVYRSANLQSARQNVSFQEIVLSREGGRAAFFSEYVIVYKSQSAITTDQKNKKKNKGHAKNIQKPKSQKLLTSSMKPGMIVRATQKGFDKWLPVGLHFAEAHAGTIIKLQPKKFNAMVYFPAFKSRTYFTLRDLKVAKVDFQLIDYEIVQPNSLMIKLSRGTVTLNGGMLAEWKVFHTGGTINIELYDIALDFVMELETNSHGILQMKPDKCSSSTGSFYIYISPARSSDIVRPIFEKYFQKDVESYANDILCEKCIAQLFNAANINLKQFSTFKKLFNHFEFDFSLVQNPVAHSPFVDFHIKGQTVNTAQLHKFSYEPGQIALDDSQARMEAVYLSDYVFNSFSYQIFSAGLLSNVPLQNYNEEIRELLQLNCAQDMQCIGNIAPKMKAIFKENSGILLMTVKDYPQTNIGNNGAEISVTARFELQYQKISSTHTEQLTTVLTFEAAIPILISSLNITKTSDPTQNKITGDGRIMASASMTITSMIEEMKPIETSLSNIALKMAQNALHKALTDGYKFYVGSNLNLDIFASFHNDHVLALYVDAS